MERYVDGIDLESLYTVQNGEFKINSEVKGSWAALAEEYYYSLINNAQNT
ncbi:hypothetical protein ABFW07_10605 [Acinetobacter soli]